MPLGHILNLHECKALISMRSTTATDRTDGGQGVSAIGHIRD